jgi:hypothetical protein
MDSLYETIERSRQKRLEREKKERSKLSQEYRDRGEKFSNFKVKVKCIRRGCGWQRTEVVPDSNPRHAGRNSLASAKWEHEHKDSLRVVSVQKMNG